MARYKLDYVVVFHPRPLACGAWVGKRKEIEARQYFNAHSDWVAQMLVSQILDPYPKLLEAPGRTVHARKLVEVDNSGKEIHEVHKWEVPAPIMRDNRQS